MSIVHTRGPDGSTAVLSTDGLYRYNLTRVLHPQHRLRKTLGVIMLNPSTADAFEDDRTIKKVMHYADAWGYNHISVANLFAIRTTYPSDLKHMTEEYRIGLGNDRFIENVIEAAHDKVLCGWGSNKLAMSQAAKVVQMHERNQDKDLVTIETLNNGMPTHPLYKRNDLQPFTWVPPS